MNVCTYVSTYVPPLPPPPHSPFRILRFKGSGRRGRGVSFGRAYARAYVRRQLAVWFLGGGTLTYVRTYPEHARTGGRGHWVARRHKYARPHERTGVRKWPSTCWCRLFVALC